VSKTETKARYEGISAHEQRLILRGVYVKDDRTVSYCNWTPHRSTGENLLIGVTQQPEERLQGLERRVRVLEKNARMNSELDAEVRKLKRAMLLDAKEAETNHRATLGLKERLDTAEGDLERLKRKRKDSVSRARVVTKSDTPPASVQPALKKSRIYRFQVGEIFEATARGCPFAMNQMQLRGWTFS
jgi:hypothetical protein